MENPINIQFRAFSENNFIPDLWLDSEYASDTTKQSTEFPSTPPSTPLANPTPGYPFAPPGKNISKTFPLPTNINITVYQNQPHLILLPLLFQRTFQHLGQDEKTANRQCHLTLYSFRINLKDASSHIFVAFFFALNLS